MTVRLQCQRCGATFHIRHEWDRFICAYCGTPHSIERLGGKITLRMLKTLELPAESTEAAKNGSALRELESRLAELRQGRSSPLSRDAARRLEWVVIVLAVIVTGLGLRFGTSWVAVGMTMLLAAILLHGGRMRLERQRNARIEDIVRRIQRMRWQRDA